MDKNQLQNLADKINKVSKPWCSHFSKTALKQSLLKNIHAETSVPFSLQPTYRNINSIGHSTNLSHEKKVALKFKLLETISTKRQRFNFNIVDLFKPKRSLLASGVLMAFMMTYLFTFNNVIFENNIASATIITSIQGNVYVTRDGKNLPAYANMMILEKDIIHTDSNSSADIKYHDDSISRLNEKSTVKVNKLFSHSKKKTFTVIEVEVVEGDVWNRVVNLTDEGSQFRVKAKDISTQASKKAAFNVQTKSNGKVEVKVLQNSVDVQSKDISANKQTIHQGFEAKIEPTTVLNKPEEIIIAENLDDTNDEQKWISENLEKDQNYINDIVKSKKETLKKNIGSLPESPLYPIKAIKGSAQLLLTVDEIEKKKLELGIANRRLQEAQVLLNNGDSETAEEMLNEFQNTAKEISSFIIEVEKENPEKVLELKINLNETIDSNMKELAPLEDNDPVFKAKEKLIATEIILDNESSNEGEDDDDDEKEIEVLAPIDDGINFDRIPIVSQFNKAESLHKTAEEQKNQGTIIIEDLGISASEDPQIFDPSGVSLKEF